MISDYEILVKNFMNHMYESSWEANIVEGNVDANINDIFDYVKRVNMVPVSDYIDYIYSEIKRQPILAADVFQFSDLGDALFRVCAEVEKVGNPGLNFKHIGKLLLNDGNERTDVAFNKYGENHIKVAEMLGLAFKHNGLFYISSIGVCINRLAPDDRHKIITRLILRNKLISQMLIASKQPLNLESFLYDLSKSTYLRRRTNIRQILGLLSDSEEYDFSYFLNNIIY